MGTQGMPIGDYATVNPTTVGRLVFEQAGPTPADCQVEGPRTCPVASGGHNSAALLKR